MYIKFVIQIEIKNYLKTKWILIRMWEKLKNFYDKKYKFLLIVPILFILASLVIIGLHYSRTGEFVSRDISLKGGITVTLNTKEEIDVNEFGDFLSSRLGKDVFVRKLTDFVSREQIGFIVETIDVSNEELKGVLKEKINFVDLDYSVEEVGPSLGEAFYKQLLWALGFAFLFMAIVVFITFRTFIPSIAIVLAPLTNLLVTLAFIDLVGIKLSTTGVAALLLMIGYSIDTDILLTSRVLKRRGEGTVIVRIFSSIKTGLSMTFTTLIALIIAYFISNSFVLKQMFLILTISLLYDIVATYLMNAVILRLYCEKKGIT